MILIAQIFIHVPRKTFWTPMFVWYGICKILLTTLDEHHNNSFFLPFCFTSKHQDRSGRASYLTSWANFMLRWMKFGIPRPFSLQVEILMS